MVSSYIALPSYAELTFLTARAILRTFFNLGEASANGGAIRQVELQVYNQVAASSSFKREINQYLLCFINLTHIQQFLLSGGEEEWTRVQGLLFPLT